MKSILLLYFLRTVVAILIYPDYKDSPCNRKCLGTTMKCHYHFVIENLFSNENECLDCLNGNSSNCHNYGCIPTDGTSKLVEVYNRRLPGPDIQVCEGDEIIVDVENKIANRSTSIHWHGMHQNGSVFMDGVPMVTQCPILPNSTFRYHFWANPSGTHMYHSHTGRQRSVGAYGHLVVRQADKVNKMRNHYDYDLQEHVISMLDWYKKSPENDHQKYLRKEIFYNDSLSAILINGLGNRQGNNTVPHQIFNVQKGSRYRFRLIHAGIGVCPIEFSIDKHSLSVIATDGYDLQPFTVEKMILTPGETYDFVLNANQNVFYYRMIFKGTLFCAGIENNAILKYSGAQHLPKRLEYKAFPPRSSEAKYKATSNCINLPNEPPFCFGLDRIKSSERLDSKYKGKPDFVYYLAIDMKQYARPKFRGTGDEELITPTINSIIFQQPTALLISSLDNQKICNIENRKNCNDSEEYCSCVHLVPANKLCELVITDLGSLGLSHPFHMHGYHFRVTAIGRLGNNTTVKYVKNLDERGKIIRNLENPPIKDTVPIPSGGYAVVRFISDNPGIWSFHCHVDFHEGMQLVFRVGQNKTPVPEGFPDCGNA